MTRFYDLGIVSLLGALLGLLIPNTGVTPLRVAATGFVVIAIGAELFWIFGQRSRVFPSLQAALRDPKNTPYVSESITTGK